MKTTTTILLLMLFYFNSGFSQEFTGFGNIKVGDTEANFISAVSAELKTSVVTVTDKNISKYRSQWYKYISSASKEPERLYKLPTPYDISNWPVVFLNKKVEMMAKANLPGVSFYFIPKYKLTDNIVLEKVIIGTIDNVVSFIQLDQNSDFTKAAEEKYKPTSITDTSFVVNCVYVNSGVKKTENSFKKIINWENENSIATSYAVYDYDDKCQFVFTSRIDFESFGFIKKYKDYIGSAIKDRNDKEDKNVSEIKSRL